MIMLNIRHTPTVSDTLLYALYIVLHLILTQTPQEAGTAKKICEMA